MNMSFYEGVKDKTEKKQPLPFYYALKKTAWQFGVVPKPTFVTIPVGVFSMGSDNGRSDEKPVHLVTLKQAFIMSRDEITFAQYDYYIWSMQQYSRQHLKKSMQKNSKTTLSVINYPYDEGWGRDSRPVINVSWEDAQGYVNWLSKQSKQSCRLPSEAEWEYAARAGTTTNYFWGDEVGKNNASCRDCGSEWDSKQTAPVGSFAANAWGLNDMHGNVWEWVQDGYHSNYQDAPADGSVWEKASSGGRGLRGGAWFFSTYDLRASVRDFVTSGSRGNVIGFRVVCALPSSER
jgi:formylglycine-generating enzyme required for sulfatase activity